jgi:hypothetical protein
MKFKVLTIFILLMIIGTASFGQYTSGSKKSKRNNGGKQPHHSVIKGDFKLPTPISNKAFRGVLNGVTDMDLSYNYRLTSDFAFGVGFKYGFWDIDVNSFPSDKVTGKMTVLNPFISVSKIFKQNRQFFIETELKFGYNSMNTIGTYNVNTFDYNQTGINFEPKIGLYLQTPSELLAFGLTINYNYIGAGFSEQNLEVDKIPGIDAGTNNGNSQYFSVGFGFYTFLPNKDDMAAAKER